MRSQAPKATRILRSWISQSPVRTAFAVGGINYAPACFEVLRHQVQTQLLKHHSAVKPALNDRIRSLFDIGMLLIKYPQVSLRMIKNIFTKPQFSPQKSRILFFSNGLHLASYAGAIRILHEKTGIKVITDTQGILDKFYLSQYHLNLQSVKKTQESISSVTLQKLQAQLRLLKVDNPLIRKSLNNVITAFLPNFFSKYSRASDIVRETKPRLVITTHDPGPSAMAFVMAAKKEKISTLVLEHGIPSEGWYFFSQRQLVWGPKTKAFICQQGIAEKRLIAGGQSIFYNYQHYFQNHPKKISSPPQIGIILSGYGTNENHQIKYVQSLVQKLRKFSFRILVRPHPGQYIDNLSGATLNVGQTIEEFINESDIIITQTSTAAVIAGLSNTPVVYFPAFHPHISQGVLWKYKALSPVASAGSCVKKVKNILESKRKQESHLKKQHRQVLEYTGPVHDKLDEELAKKISKLIP